MFRNMTKKALSEVNQEILKLREQLAFLKDAQERSRKNKNNQEEDLLQIHQNADQIGKLEEQLEDAINKIHYDVEWKKQVTDLKNQLAKQYKLLSGSKKGFLSLTSTCDARAEYLICLMDCLSVQSSLYQVYKKLYISQLSWSYLLIKYRKVLGDFQSALVQITNQGDIKNSVAAVYFEFLIRYQLECSLGFYNLNADSSACRKALALAKAAVRNFDNLVVCAPERLKKKDTIEFHSLLKKHVSYCHHYAAQCEIDYADQPQVDRVKAYYQAVEHLQAHIDLLYEVVSFSQEDRRSIKEAYAQLSELYSILGAEELDVSKREICFSRASAAQFDKLSLMAPQLHADLSLLAACFQREKANLSHQRRDIELLEKMPMVQADVTHGTASGSGIPLVAPAREAKNVVLFKPRPVRPWLAIPLLTEEANRITSPVLEMKSPTP